MNRTTRHNGFAVDVTGPAQYVDDAIAALNAFSPLLDAAIAATERCHCTRREIELGHCSGCFVPDLEAAIRLAKVTSRTPVKRGGGG